MGHDCDDENGSGDRFWVEDPLALLTDFTLIPRAKMTLEQKMNVITRIVIVVWILLLVVKYKHATVFFLTTLLIIILIYYSRKRHEDRITRLVARLSRSSGDRHQVRSENPTEFNSPSQNQPPADGTFTRFEAKSGNKMTEFVKKNEEDQKSSEEHRRLKELLKIKKIERKLQKEEEKSMRKKNQEEELVRAEQVKRDPRRPWPPVVPFSMEVKGARGDLDEARQANLRKAYLGGPRRLAESKFHGYHVEAFQDESGEESGNYEDEDRQEVEAAYQSLKPTPTPEAVQESKPAKRTFLPANHDMAQDKAPPVKNENPKMTRHGAARARRVPKWGDDNEVKTMHEASEMQYTRASKLEKETNTKGRINYERKSQVTSLFG